MVSVIVAVAENGVIGDKNSLLWHISEDLRNFKRVTSGHPVIMGRKTYESIGRPLPKRINIVVSRGADTPEGTLLAGSLEDAFAMAEASILDVPAAESTQSLAAADSSTGTEQSQSRCFVMGGGQLYAQAMPSADRLIVTHVHTVIEDADTFFPEIDTAIWRVVDRSEMLHDEESGYNFEFVEYVPYHPER